VADRPARVRVVRRQPAAPGAPPANFTLDNYAALAKPANFEAAKNSLVLAVFGTAGAVALGGGLAWLAGADERAGALARPGHRDHAAVPGPLIGALAWSFLAAPRSGYLNSSCASSGSRSSSTSCRSGG
jgi:iron(III) transport system permease protein